MDRETGHPSDQTLDSYRLGQLDDTAVALVTKHLEVCAECRRSLAARSSASFLNWVGGNRNEAPPTQSPGETNQPRAGAGAAAVVASLAATLPPGLADHRDYEIKKELGRGGMGVVYLAHNTLLGRDEVLKVMGRHIMERPSVVDRFHREMRAVAKLRHPNIVSAYSAFRLGESIVFAMEHIEGLDLSKMIRAKGPLPIAHASMFVYQTALGLQHAHEQGLVHRDIKPGNLMLSREGQKATIKILDFGLAKATRDGEHDSSLTADGQVLGTPDFIAPEQILGARTVDIRADIYSLGGTFYYLLTGRPPFISRSFHAICQAHLARDAEPLNFVRPDVPAELAAIVARMMAKDPARRFQTPGEVAAALVPFFKQPKAADMNPRPVVSHVAPAFAETRPATDAESLAAAAGKAVESSVPESRWESLVDCRDADIESERLRDSAFETGDRPYWKTWPMLVAGCLLAAIVLGAIFFITVKNQPRRESLDSASTDGPGKTIGTSADADADVDVDVSGEEVAAFSAKAAEAAGKDFPEADRARPADSKFTPASTVADAVPRRTPGPEVTSRPALPSTAATKSAGENPFAAATRSVFVDDFDDTNGKWPRGRDHGYADGAYFVGPVKKSRSWRSPTDILADGTIEVVGRLKTEGPVTHGAWTVTISKLMAKGRRGPMVKINNKGELFVQPHPADDAIEFRAVEPAIGPIVHPAIRPGHELNTLLLVIKKRNVEIFVNSVRVCGPFTLEYDPTPAYLVLGETDGPTSFPAEFARVEIREFANNKGPALVPAAASTSVALDDSIRRETHSTYVDDFSDATSGWQRQDNRNYADGVYYVNPGAGIGYFPSPRRIRTDTLLEVVGRIKPSGPITRGAWGVFVWSTRHDGTGFVVSLNRNGELFLRPSQDPKAVEFKTIDPTFGPIAHPAIKPGDQENTLGLIIKKRSLEIYVNSVRVCGPLTYGYDLTPVGLFARCLGGSRSFPSRI